MAKGMFTQGIMVLFESAPTMEAIEGALQGRQVAKRVPQGDEPDSWAMGGETIVLPFGDGDRGHILVDIVDRMWPDDMGDPKENFMVFGAWSMGHFGPLAFPGNLERAGQFTQSCPGVEQLPPLHRAFVRLRTSWVGGPDDPVMPPDYQPVPELEELMDVAQQILSLPGALCYFNPGGEVLRTGDLLRETRDFHRQHGQLPLELWVNIRLFRVDEEWIVMDTVGHGQLDLPDLETCFRIDGHDPGEVERFLRNVAYYLVAQGDVIGTGETVDGPGDMHWRALRSDEALSAPPRPVVRLFPVDGVDPPEVLTAVSREDDDPDSPPGQGPVN